MNIDTGHNPRHSSTPAASRADTSANEKCIECTAQHIGATRQADTVERVPRLGPFGLADSIDVPGVPRLPADLDGHLLAACSVPTLLAVSQVSRCTRAATHVFLRARGLPGGVHDRLHRKRFKYAWRRNAQLKRGIHESRKRLVHILEYFRDDDPVRRLRLQRSRAKLSYLFLQAQSESDVDLHPFPDGESCAIVEALSDPTLTSIYLPLYSRSPGDWPDLVKAATSVDQWDCLSLDFSSLPSGRFHDDALAALHAMCTSRARHARLRLVLGAALSCDDVETLAAFLRATPSCTELVLSEIPTEKQVLEKLVALLPSCAIDSVSFLSRLPKSQQQMLVLLLDNPRLEHLTIEFAFLRDFGARLFAGALARNKNLKSLEWRRNQVGDNAVVCLVKAIAAHPTLERLRFSDGKFKQASWAKIGQALATSHTLTDIGINESMCLGDSILIMPTTRLHDADIVFSEPKEKEQNRLSLLARLVGRDNLVHLDLSHFYVTIEILPLFQQLLENSHALRRLGKCHLPDLAVVCGFAAIMQRTRVRLTVECSCPQVLQHVLAAATQDNPLLDFEFSS